MNSLINTLTNTTPLPMELWLKIIYKHKGFQTPTAMLIKNYMEENELNEYVQLDYLVKYENLSARSRNPCSLWRFITENLIDQEKDEWDESEDNKYNYFWANDYFNWRMSL
tara:strand:- start:94 stop:426 length:333 start_codon:yes stop_codon:yes gene_type:complete